jgi:ubiquinone/menaquinone biosynthesis C-methylase UbiE
MSSNVDARVPTDWPPTHGIMRATRQPVKLRRMGPDKREVDERQRELWRRGAQGWDRRQEALREKTAPVSNWLVDAIDPQPGQRVLDLAAGPGETGFLAARRLGAEGRLLSTDQAPEMVEVARRRAGELGLENVDFAAIDAQHLELEPGSFDAAVCRWGYMLMAEPDEAMRRTRLALREGGRLALATWDRPDRNLWLAAPVMALVAQGALPPPTPGDPSPFALHDPADLERRLRAAGFGSVRVDQLGFPQPYPSFDDYWAETIDLAAPIAAAVAGLTPDAAEAVRAATRQTLSRFTDADGRIEAPASAVVALAVA